MLASLEFVAATTSSLALKFPGIPGIRRGKPAKPERSGCSSLRINSLRRSAAPALCGRPSFEQVISALSGSRYPVSRMVP
jgi:hypothetical protein